MLLKTDGSFAAHHSISISCWYPSLPISSQLPTSAGTNQTLRQHALSISTIIDIYIYHISFLISPPSVNFYFTPHDEHGHDVGPTQYYSIFRHHVGTMTDTPSCWMLNYIIIMEIMTTVSTSSCHYDAINLQIELNF